MGTTSRILSFFTELSLPVAAKTAAWLLLASPFPWHDKQRQGKQSNARDETVASVGGFDGYML